MRLTLLTYWICKDILASIVDLRGVWTWSCGANQSGYPSLKHFKELLENNILQMLYAIESNLFVYMDFGMQKWVIEHFSKALYTHTDTHTDSRDDVWLGG